MKTCTPRLTVDNAVNNFPLFKRSLFLVVFLLFGLGSSSAQTPCQPVLDCIGSQVVSCVNSAASAVGDPGYRPEFLTSCGFAPSQLVYTTWPVAINDCDSIYSKVIYRMWGVSGYPTLCTDTTYVVRVDISSDGLVCPDGRDTVLCGIDPDPLSVVSLRAPVYQISGVDTFALVPGMGNECGVFVEFNDVIWPSCGNTKTVMRTWLLHDLCGNHLECYDTIVYIDTLAPFVSFDTLSLSLDTHDVDGVIKEYLTDTIGMSASGCVGHGLAPYLAVSDNCSAAADISVSVLGITSLVTFHYTGNQVITLPLWNIPGEREVMVYRSTDGCGNTRMDTVVLIIADRTAPTAVCHDKVNLSLTNTDQFSFMKAESLDAESDDNCGVYKILARRTDWLTACGYEDGSPTLIGDYYQHYANWVAMDPGICQDIFQFGFAPEVPFCCEDVGKEIMVEIMIIDFNCNIDLCWGVVKVEDKLAPIVVQALPDISISCNAYVQYYQDMFAQENTPQIRSAFGKYVLDVADRESFMVQNILCADLSQTVDVPYLDGLLSDNCGGSFLERYAVPEEGCGNSYILREFLATVSTDHGTKEIVFATQRIHIEKCPLNLMDIELPVEDTTVYGCGFTFGLDGNATVVTPGPTLPEMIPGCGQYGIGYFDKLFEIVNGVGCYKILRTWCIVDWCEVQGANDWSSIAKQPGSVTFTQYIKIIDTIAPVITPVSLVADIQTVSCSGAIRGEINATDNCGEPSTQWELRTQAGVFVTGGFGKIAEPSNLLPPNAYRLIWKVTDPCGNVAQLISDFTISSDAKPSIVAKTSLTTTLTPMDTNNDGIIDMGRAEIWAAEFNSSSAPACGGDPDNLRFLIARGFADDSSPVPSENATGLQFTCADYSVSPTIIPVQFWVKDVVSGGADYLNVMVQLYDNNKVCSSQEPPQAVAVISGQINTETQVEIANVIVKVVNGVEEAVVTTGEAGLYQAGIPLVDHTMIIPEKDTDHSNGISTADLIRIQKHILGIKTIVSPYKLIAADANRDQKINPIDLIQMRKILLGKIDRFPENESWRFVDAGYRFVRPENALEENYPEYIELQKGTGREAKKNFIGVKIGDLDDNVYASQASNRSNDARVLSVMDREVKNGEMVTVPVFSQDVMLIDGIQLQLQADINKFKLVGVENGELSLNDEMTELVDHEKLRLSYLNVEGQWLDKTKPLFFVKVLGITNARLSDALTIADRDFKAEVYLPEQLTGTVKLAFETSAEPSRTESLVQNRPNPFRAETVIEFWLQESQDAHLRIYDVSGKIVKEVKQNYPAGWQQVIISGADLKPGMLYYELLTNKGRETKRMILLD